MTVQPPLVITLGGQMIGYKRRALLELTEPAGDRHFAHIVTNEQPVIYCPLGKHLRSSYSKGGPSNKNKEFWLMSSMQTILVLIF